MTTHARFEFAGSHLPGSCMPDPGVIRGTLYPDLRGGTYTLVFLAGTEPCAGIDDVTTGGDPVELALEHVRDTGLLNITVRIERMEPSPPATRVQIPERICLRVAD